MKSYDYEAVTYDGEVYCVECLPEGVDIESDEVMPIFADSEWESAPVCCVCGHVHDYVTIIVRARPEIHQCYFHMPDVTCNQVVVVKEHEGSICIDASKVWTWARATKKHVKGWIRERLWLAGVERDELENLASAVTETLAELGVIYVYEAKEGVKNHAGANDPTCES